MSPQFLLETNQEQLDSQSDDRYVYKASLSLTSGDISQCVLALRVAAVDKKGKLAKDWLFTAKVNTDEFQATLKGSTSLAPMIEGGNKLPCAFTALAHEAAQAVMSAHMRNFSEAHLQQAFTKVMLKHGIALSNDAQPTQDAAVPMTCVYEAEPTATLPCMHVYESSPSR